MFGKVYKVKKLNSSGDLYAMKVLEKSLVTKFKFNINLRLLIVSGMCNKILKKFVGIMSVIRF